MEGFLNFNFLSLEQECTLHQPGIRVEYNDEATSKLQAGSREESARPPILQQQRTTAWPTQQSKEFDRGRPKNDDVNFLTNVCLHVVFLFCPLYIA